MKNTSGWILALLLASTLFAAPTTSRKKVKSKKAKTTKQQVIRKPAAEKKAASKEELTYVPVGTSPTETQPPAKPRTGPIDIETETELSIDVPPPEAKPPAPIPIPTQRPTHTVAPPNELPASHWVGDKRSKHSISAGFAAGSTYFIPTLHFQRAIDEQLSFGLMPVLFTNFSATDTDRILGGFATFTYSLETPFNGPFFGFGFGLYSLYAKSATREFRSTPFAFYVDCGWNPQIGEKWNLTLAAGVHYVSDSNKDEELLRFGGVMPLLHVAIGREF